MARKRYPSDDQRRKQRPHAKVHLSIRSHPRYGEAFEDPEIRGIIVGLWVLAVHYHAAQTDDVVSLSHGDVAWLTDREQRRAGLARLRRACDAMGYVVRDHGKRVEVEVRNLAQKQGFNSATPHGATRTPDPSEEPKNQGTEEPITTASQSSARADSDSDEIPWKALRNLRPKGPNAPSELVWETFLSHEYAVMDAWRAEKPAERKWPATVARFWRSRRANSGFETAEEIVARRDEADRLSGFLQ